MMRSSTPGRVSPEGSSPDAPCWPLAPVGCGVESPLEGGVGKLEELNKFDLLVIL